MPAMSQKSPCLWTWLPQGSQSPCDRYKHACCTYDGDVYVLGGRDTHCLRDFWRYSVVRNEWTELVCTGEAAPEELEEHSMVAHEGFLYVFGGMLDSAYTEWRCPLWVFHIAKQKWVHWQGKKSSPQTQMPTNRKGHSAVVFGSAMFVYGGYVDMRGSSQEFWSLNYDTMAWSLLDGGSQQASLGPGPRHSHSATAHLDCMYLFGGLRGLREQRDFWRWNSSSRTWSSLKTMSLQTGGPLSRGLQGQHAPVRGRREPELARELPVEVQLHLAGLGAAGHAPRLHRPPQDPPLLRRAGPQLPSRDRRPLLRLGTQTQAAGRQTQALQEQVLPLAARFPGVRGRYRAGDVQPGRGPRRQDARRVFAGGPR
ncbi:actin-fragmin kinase isoform X2 [Centroberyx affinis]|uniref:actin-fragmin kinase isoform X2 n=1 Tax=Centroberyx affinis TaxID=166261 RepID=UPI003A5C6A78